METGMLNPFHNEEGQFGIDRDPQETSPWGSDHDVHENHLTSSDGKEEDFRRTLHDWRRHVDAFPMPDTDDYIPNEMLPADIFEQTPSPSKTKEFCFLPQNINNSMNDVTSPQSTPSKGGHSYTINQTQHNYTSQLRGDNRLMDNDNTSFKQESFTCSTDDEDSDISECDPGMDMLSNGFQIIPVNPDLDLSSDSSVKSSSRSSSPDNYSSSDSQCPVLQHALQKSMVDDVDDENHERNDLESDVKEFLPVFPNIMEYCIQKTPENIRFNKIVAMNSPGQYKRQNKKSISLPQSPKHVPHTPSELDGLDLHTNLSFEDMKLLDFSEFVNGSPNSFNKKFDICEEFDTAASFSETRHFNQKRELKPTDLGVSKISADVKCKPIHPTSNDILSIIEKTAINEHELNTSDILFPCRMDDLEVGDFDLPSFIMDDLHVDSSCLLKDGLECSPVISKPIKYSSKIKNNSFDCNGSIDNLTDFPRINDNNDVKPISAAVSTPKLKTELFCSMDDNYQHYQNGKTQDSTIASTMNDENTYAMEKITCNGEVISLTAAVDVSNASATDISKGDTEDFVDVETIDEGDSFTVLAANNVNALWEQFEATEELDIRNRLSTPSAVNNLGLNVLDKATEALSTKDKSQLMTLDGKRALPWSLPIRPYMVIPGMSKNKWQESPSKKQPKPEIVSPILLVKDHTVSLHNTSNKSIHLDHDYCSPVRIKQNNQSLIGNGHNESETDDLKDCQFVSPNRQDVTNLSSVYKMLNLSKQKLGLGKGKSISMCISKDALTDEFTENSDNSLPPIKLPKSSSQTLKTVKLTPFKSDSSVHSKYSESDSDCSMSDHSYSKADFNKRLPECKNIADDNRKTFKRNSLCTAKDDFNSVDSNTQDTSSLNVSDKTLNFDENNSRNAQNLIVLKNGSERLTEMSKTSNSLINKSSFTKNNKNSLLINNINKNINGKESVIRKLVLNVNDRAPAIRQKQSLLKPTVRNEIKMVSLLKCNNEKNMPIECEKPVVKTEPKAVVIKTEESHENTIFSNIIKGIDTVQPSNIVISDKLLKIEDQQIVIDNVENVEQNTTDKIDKKLPLKRKLNLEEYKKRRGNSTRSCETSRTCSPVICAPDNFAFSSPNSPAPIVETLAKPAKVAESTPSLTEMLQNVLCNPKQLQKCPEVNGAPVTPVDKEAESNKKSETVNNKKVFNPIAEASKKALQLKKMAALLLKDKKIILNKIPKIANNAILPMASENGKILPMTKNVDEVESDPISLAPTRRKNSDYEEIIMFSVGVNTNPVIIIDEIDEKESSAVESQAIDKSNILKPSIHFKIKQNKTKIVLQKNVFDTGLKEFFSSNSEQGVNNKDNFVETVPHVDVDKKMFKDLLKASKIDKNLESINATLEKVERRKDLKITSNSLIASIQDVVHKKNSKNSASRSPEVNVTSVHKTSNTITVKKEVDKKTVTSKSRKLDEKILIENVRNSSDLSIIKKSDEVLIQDIFDISVIKQLLQDTDASEDKSNIAVLKLDHGEDKVIMHLKKDRVRPDTCTIAIQTDFNILIKDILENDDDLTVKEENDIDMNDNIAEVLDNSVDTIKKPDDKKDVKNESKNDLKSEKEKSVEYAKKIQPDRSYRRRKDSLSSEASAENIDSANRRKDRRTSRDRYEITRKTNSRERHYRTSRSPGSSRRSANRSRSWGRYNRYNNRNNRRQDVRHNRRSRSISRDRRKRNNSRDWKSYRPYISARNSNSNRDRSRSRFNDRDDRSVRSVNSNSSKRKRLSSRSSHERQSSRLHTMKKSTKEPERTSISLDRDHDLLEKEAHKSNDDVFVPSGEEPNVSVSKEISNLGSKPNRSRRRKSTECSNASYASRLTKSSSRYSSDSEDNSSSSDSSSSSSSSSDSDSSDSDSEREFNSTDTKKTSLSSNRPKSELVEERRQVFVGRLESDLTKAELRMKFIKYGQVTEVTTHKKDDGSRYGFVTFGQAEQAYRVVERANADPDLKRYDVSFGGRRQFCRQFYSDLDDLEAVEDTEFYMAMAPRPIVAAVPDVSFDFLLEEMKAAMAKKVKIQILELNPPKDHGLHKAEPRVIVKSEVDVIDKFKYAVSELLMRDYNENNLSQNLSEISFYCTILNR